MTFTRPHRRKNILTGDWVLVSPQRTQRPWQGEISEAMEHPRAAYDPACYLCPGNVRANGERNPNYTSTYVFTNDFAALDGSPVEKYETKNPFFTARPERGVCRVVNFSPRHDLSLADMSEPDIVNVIETWKKECASIAENRRIRHIQIFENKGAMMGNSNPHPHCQIWAQENIPMETAKELLQCRKYYSRKKHAILSDYVRFEIRASDRIVFENDRFVVLTPFWAVWPFETMIVPRRRMESILDFSLSDVSFFANALSRLTKSYDALFQAPFPYSSGIHQAPTDGHRHPEWCLHMHFYPPLLRSANIRKFMVGYEMLAEPQRDVTPEESAKLLRSTFVKTLT
ncbi:MAG: galactose-1-phosphate uridylyltransferase [Ignavibacteria bacterium RIFCSPLOWO2_02_FULL_55_14]|nr:MAG: galactose-1-phosphate uridylyltransferase [Ignavibacteria bacterium RIFCSPHIGHO2_02_FULL_56_12]OGU70260.1 MAG: galactose-1-phosphate uridylyltransferase [Ignavibacteria bacterium RIFCSPLOWO2_02_FULL_55_14]OGU74934.1 MAG: galactose-1-phosphate uridylyltransferase [Ignavibacteria bacterium RIFCSPLOWO2_12_FULL_56_21]